MKPAALDLFLVVSFGLAAAAASLNDFDYVTTKRTFASTSSAADLAFFTRFFGVNDPSATHDPGCLERDLAWSLQSMLV